MQSLLDDLIQQLYHIEAVKFGDFTLKSGIQSPIYIDLRVIVSYPNLIKLVSEIMWQMAQPLSFDNICGVPYTALPIATCLSITHDVPMLMRRKEAKNYGTKKLIEGVMQPQQKCLIIEDVITSGGSVLETATVLREQQLQVTDTLVLIDRAQGGAENLAKQGVTAHSITTLPNLFSRLTQLQEIPSDVQQRVHDFLASNSQ